MASIDIKDLLDQLKNILPQGMTPAPDNSMSPGGQSVITPEGNGMSMPSPDNDTLYSSSGVPKLPAPVGAPSAPTNTAATLPSLSGIIGNWHTLSDQQKGDVLRNIGVGMLNNSRGNSIAGAFGKSVGGYDATKTAEDAVALAQKNKERELGQKDTENTNTLALKEATLANQETPREKRRRTNMDDARQFAATRDMLGNAVVDPVKMNKYLVSVGEEPINIADSGAAVPPPAASPSFMSRIFGDSKAPAPVGYQPPATTPGPIALPKSVAPQAAQPSAPSTPSGTPDGTIIVNKKTGEKMVRKGGKWQSVQ